jgi:hypothetical protein
MKPSMFIGLALIAFGVGTLVLRDLIYIKQKKIITINPAKDVDSEKKSADEEN